MRYLIPTPGQIWKAFWFAVLILFLAGTWTSFWVAFAFAWAMATALTASRAIHGVKDSTE